MRIVLLTLLTLVMLGMIKTWNKYTNNVLLNCYSRTVQYGKWSALISWYLCSTAMKKYRKQEYL